MRIALVASRFNAEVTELMTAEAEKRIAELGQSHAGTVRVPGAFDAPLAVQRVLVRHDVDAVVVVGAVITGDTDHDQVLMQATAKTLQELALAHDKPVMLAITGPGMTVEQARERIGYAAEAVKACVELHEALAAEAGRH